ncbi:MAG: FMN-binding protein, partial [Candidatus Ventricola sp.]
MNHRKLLTLALSLVLALALCASGVCETLTGEAEGFGGPIKAELTVESGVITALTLTGEAETPAIGGVALESLTQAILAAGTVDGVDAVAGATWTSNGAFAAVRKALGIEEAAAEPETAEAVTANGLSHGI